MSKTDTTAPDLPATAPSKKSTAFSKYRPSSTYTNNNPSDLGEHPNRKSTSLPSVTELSASLSQAFEKEAFATIPTVPTDRTIVDVYNDNLLKSLKRIKKLTKKFNYISIDFTHPGILVSCGKRPEWDRIHTNVSLTNPIQMCFNLTNENNEFGGIFRFNLHFSLAHEMFSEDNVQKLKKTISFELLEDKGIDRDCLGERLISSGLLLNKNIYWLSYQSGHNYATMLQLLRANMIPYDENDFFKLVNIYFPNLYDIRYIAAKKFKNPLAAQLYFEKTTLESPEKNTPADKSCQLISSLFFHLKAILLRFESFDPITFNGFIYGIGSATVAQPTPVHPIKHQEKLVKQISLTKERIIAKSIDDLKLPEGIRIVKPSDDLEKVEIAVNA